MCKLPFEIALLLYKHKTGTLSDEAEMEQLRQWLIDSRQNKKMFDKVVSSENFHGYSKKIRSLDVEKAWKTFQHNQQKRKRRKLRVAFLKYAAVLFVALILPITLFWWYNSNDKTENQQSREIQTTHEKIVPGTTRAILTLHSGKQFELEVGKELSSDQIVGYAVSNEAASTAEDEAFSTIETPVGGEYRLHLSDGSTISLNNQTTLRFPNKFASGKREIELLAGEIYLDVYPMPESPFFVKTKELTIKVVGTSFNLSTYDYYYRTTLVKGRVEVLLGTGEAFKLNPSEQLGFVAGSRPAGIKRVDTDLYTSWVDGRFVFKDETIEEILKSLSRWYNFNFVFDCSELKEYRFGIHINKYDNIKSFLNIV